MIVKDFCFVSLVFIWDFSFDSVFLLYDSNFTNSDDEIFETTYWNYKKRNESNAVVFLLIPTITFWTRNSNTNVHGCSNLFRLENKNCFPSPFVCCLIKHKRENRWSSFTIAISEDEILKYLEWILTTRRAWYQHVSTDDSLLFSCSSLHP